MVVIMAAAWESTCGLQGGRGPCAGLYRGFWGFAVDEH